MAEHPRPAPAWVGTQNLEPASQFCKVIKTLPLFGEMLALGEAGQAPSAHAAPHASAREQLVGVGWSVRTMLQNWQAFSSNRTSERETHAILSQHIGPWALLMCPLSCARVWCVGHSSHFSSFLSEEPIFSPSPLLSESLRGKKPHSTNKQKQRRLSCNPKVRLPKTPWETHSKWDAARLIECSFLFPH